MFAFPCLNHSIPSTCIFMVHLKTSHKRRCKRSFKVLKEKKAEREMRGVKSGKEEQSTAAVLDSAVSLLQSQP